MSQPRNILKSAKHFLSVLLFLSLGFSLNSCTEQENSVYYPEYSDKAPFEIKQYILGIHPLHNPQKLQKVFGPLADYINKNIPGINLIIEASRNYAAYDKKLYAAKFDFSLPNPYQTVNSLKHNYRVFAKMGDDENFRGIIIVRKDSVIKVPTDLKGKAVSYPAPTALAATMLPQLYLQNNGLDVENDLDNRYVGSQESSIMNIFMGDTVAGSTWPPPWHAFKKSRPEIAKELVVIWETKPLLNNGLVVRDNIPEELVKKVQNLIVNLHHNPEGQAILARMELSKFEIADNETYQPVLDFIDTFDARVRKIK